MRAQCHRSSRSERGVLIVHFHRTITKQNRAISAVGSSLWKGLSLAMHLFPKVHSDAFLCLPQNCPFQSCWETLGSLMQWIWTSRVHVCAAKSFTDLRSRTYRWTQSPSQLLRRPVRENCFVPSSRSEKCKKF